LRSKKERPASLRAAFSLAPRTGLEPGTCGLTDYRRLAQFQALRSFYVPQLPGVTSFSFPKELVVALIAERPCCRSETTGSGHRSQITPRDSQGLLATLRSRSDFRAADIRLTQSGRPRAGRKLIVAIHVNRFHPWLTKSFGDTLTGDAFRRVQFPFTYDYSSSASRQTASSVSLEPSASRRTSSLGASFWRSTACSRSCARASFG